MKNFTLAVAFGAAIMIAAPAHAKDWIDKVDVIASGIDAVPIEVTANLNGYQSIKTKNHKFSVRLFARAKSGKRIAAGKVGTHKSVEFFEADNGWSRNLAHRDVGGGQLKQLKREFQFNVPVSGISWVGANPVQVCRDMLIQKVNSGQKKTTVLSKNRMVGAKAWFSFSAVAARPKAAKSGKFSLSNATSETKSYIYPVQVRCLSGQRFSN